MPQAVTRVRALTQDITALGEGPYWDEVNEHLYYVDAFAGHICRLTPTTGAVEKITFPGLVTIVIAYQNEQNMIISYRNEVRKLNWASGVYTLIATVAPQLGGRERFNDGKCDPRGRLFIGTVLDDPKTGKIVPGGGSLYRLDGNEFTKVSEGYDISNGISWSNDLSASKMYFNDSEGRKMYVFDYDIETGTPSNRQVLIDFANGEIPGYPDGMTMDKFGYIWTAMYAGARILKIDPDTATVVDQVMLPTAGIPTSLAWGKFQGEDGFFVTTATGTDLPDDGKVLRVDILGGNAYKFIPEVP